MKQEIFEIRGNKRIADRIYKMELSGDTSSIVRPGQFINIAVEGFYLRRPISVCDWEEDRLTIIYKTVGGGTEALSRMERGEKLDALTGLGNGYDMAKSGKRPLLFGGGAGVPPLYGLAKRLKAAGAEPVAVLGFNTADEVFLEEEFSKLGVKAVITTADGSRGTKGFVTDAEVPGGTYFYACGPEPMLKALCMTEKIPGQLSFEERMGCGFGACMGCSCKTKYGSKRICRDGPVLEKEEIIW